MLSRPSDSPFSIAGKGLRVIGDGSTQVAITGNRTVALGPTAAGQILWIEGLRFEMSSSTVGAE